MALSPGLRSLRVWSVYLLTIGVALLLAPNLVLRMLGVAETNEVWLRVVGVVVIALGVLDADIVRRRDEAALWSTVMARAIGGVLLLALAFATGPWQLSLFGLLDLASGTWTWAALRSKD